MLGVVIIEAIICVACYIIVDYMVTHRTGMAKNMIIGEDSREDKLSMLELAVYVYRGQTNVPTNLKNYTLSTIVENNKIVKTMVETEKTILTYNEKDGERFVEKGFTEKGAIILNTILLVGLVTCIFLIGVWFFFNRG